jgi:hypothetical protein
MNAILAETVKDVGTGYSSLVKSGIIILIGIGVFVWWLKRQT